MVMPEERSHGEVYKNPRKLLPPAPGKAEASSRRQAGEPEGKHPKVGRLKAQHPKVGRPQAQEPHTLAHCTHTCAQILDLLMLQSFQPLQAALCPPNPP